MKRSFIATICLFVAAAFAGPYDIEEFAAQDAGSPDEVITAEFGGELKTIPVEEVATLQEGRLVVRQKFTDPFGEQPPAYQIYQGGAGDLSSLTALTAPEGPDYTALVKAKFYPRRGMPATDDVEKVYFDGKSVFVPGATTAIAFINGDPVQLKAANADAAAEDAEFAAADAGAGPKDDEEECDENDEECEDEEEEDEDYDVASNVDNSEADERDNAAYDASSNVTDRFGIADEVRFWSAVGLAAVFVGSAVMGVLQHSKANEAKDAYDDLEDVEKKLIGEVDKACNYDGKCREAMIQKADLGNGYTIAQLQARKKTNKKTQDSYSTARNIWFGVAGLSLTAAIVLYVW
ncbi:MAG: hypothetical protein IJ909_08600 [Fibrobacter sp.]|nr:hypothetical protein [Fibrobacter sp.]